MYISNVGSWTGIRNAWHVFTVAYVTTFHRHTFPHPTHIPGQQLPQYLTFRYRQISPWFLNKRSRIIHIILYTIVSDLVWRNDFWFVLSLFSRSTRNFILTIPECSRLIYRHFCRSHGLFIYKMKRGGHILNPMSRFLYFCEIFFSVFKFDVPTPVDGCSITGTPDDPM